MKKNVKVKKERAVLTRDVTLRFLVVMHEIIATHKRNGGPCRNVKAFAKSIDANASVFSQYDDKNYNRNITLEMCCEIFKVHKVNMNWLIGGKGDRFFSAEAANRLNTLEERLEKLVQTLESKVEPVAAAKPAAVKPVAKKAAKKGKK